MKNKNRLNIHDRQIYANIALALAAAKKHKSVYNFSDKGLKIKVWHYKPDGKLAVLFLLVNPRKQKPHQAP